MPDSDSPVPELVRGIGRNLRVAATPRHRLGGCAAPSPPRGWLQQPVSLTCTGGLPLVVNPGTLTNQGRVAWAIGSNGVFVTADLALSNRAEDGGSPPPQTAAGG